MRPTITSNELARMSGVGWIFTVDLTDAKRAIMTQNGPRLGSVCLPPDLDARRGPDIESSGMTMRDLIKEKVEADKLLGATRACSKA